MYFSYIYYVMSIFISLFYQSSIMFAMSLLIASLLSIFLVHNVMSLFAIFLSIVFSIIILECIFNDYIRYLNHQYWRMN